MLLLTNCEVHMGKYLDHSFEVWTERSEITLREAKDLRQEGIMSNKMSNPGILPGHLKKSID